MKIKKLLFGGILASAMTLGLISLATNWRPVGAEAIIENDEVSINGITFDSGGSQYYKNTDAGTPDFTGSALDYNAFFDRDSSTLELKDFDGGRIYVDSTDAINLVLTGTNKITVSYDNEISGFYARGGVVIKGDGSLTVEVSKDSPYGNAYGIRAGEYLTVQGDVDVTVDMSGVEVGTAKGLYSVEGLYLSGHAALTVNMTAHEDQNNFIYGIATDKGDMRFTSTGDLTVNMESDSGMDNFAIFNKAADKDVADNGDIFFSGSGKVTLNKTGGGYSKGIVSNRDTDNNLEGVIEFEGADTEVEINGFAYAVLSESKELIPDGYDIYIHNGATVNIESYYENFPDGLCSVSNGILIDGGDYSYTGSGYPINLSYSDGIYNHSLYGFDVKNASHVLIRTTEYIATPSGSTSEIDLSGDGSFDYGNLQGNCPRYEGTYNIKQGANTLMLNPSRINKRYYGTTPDGCFALGGWSGYGEFPIKFEAFVCPLPSNVSVGGGVNFTNTKLYYINGDAEPRSEAELGGEDYNARFDKDEGALYLKGYDSDYISFNNFDGARLRIVVEEQSTINSIGYGIDVIGSGASLEITSKEIGGNRKLTINTRRTSSSTDVRGIGVAHGSLTVCGAATLEIQTYVQGEATGNSIPIDVGYALASQKVSIEDHAAVRLFAHSLYASGNDAAIRASGRVKFNNPVYPSYTTSVLDASDVAGTSYGIFGGSYEFTNYTPLDLKYHGSGAPLYNGNIRTIVTNGSVNIDPDNKVASIEYGTSHHVEVVNGVRWDEGHYDGNYIHGNNTYFYAYNVAGVNFDHWEVENDSIVNNPTGETTWASVQSDDVITARYNFVYSQPVWDTRGSTETGYINFSLRGTPTKVVVVNAADNSVAYEAQNVTKALAFTSVMLPDGTYRLRAQYEAMGDHTMFEFTHQFVVNHTAAACDWNVTYHAGEGTGADHALSTHGAYNLAAFNTTGFTAPEGKRFLAWAEGSLSGSQYAAGVERNIVDDVDYFAIYEDIPSYTMSYAGGAGVTGGSMVGQVKLEGENFVLPESTFEHGAHMTFDYWDVGGAHKQPGDTIEATGNMSATANYVLLPQKTLTLAAGDGTGSMDAIEKYTDENFVLPDSTFVAPENFEFSYWDVGGTPKEPGDEIPATSDITATAKYTRIQCTITFAAGDGTGSMANVKWGKGLDYTLPGSTFTAPAHKQFSGWQIGGVEYQPGENYIISGNITITALYEDIVHNVTFSAGEGSGTMAGTTKIDGQSFTLPECTFTAPEHKQFKCWSVGGEEKAVGASIEITADTVITALYENIPVNITVEVEGGSGSQIISGTDGGQIVLPQCTLTAPAGKQFDGWIVDGVKHAAGDSVTINAGSTIKAAWKDIPATDPETPTTPDTPTTPETPENPPKKGLSGGAIAGIVIASVVVVGVGGFAVTWFVILKKTFADFLAMFKKK